MVLWVGWSIVYALKRAVEKSAEAAAIAATATVATTFTANALQYTFKGLEMYYGNSVPGWFMSFVQWFGWENDVTTKPPSPCALTDQLTRKECLSASWYHR